LKPATPRELVLKWSLFPATAERGVYFATYRGSFIGPEPALKNDGARWLRDAWQRSARPQSRTCGRVRPPTLASNETRSAGGGPRGIAALLDRIEGNGVRIVLVEDASRFARDLVVQELGIALLARRGVRLVTLGR
jgi:hypothetical protein